MGIAKTIQLVARSASSASLAFEIGGIVSESLATLGQQVNAFDFPGFYKTLGVGAEAAAAVVKVGKKPPHFKGPPFTPYLYNSADLDSQLESSSLMRLRAEPIKALLDKMCVARANIYINKYGHIASIKEQAQAFYTGGASKASSLDQLAALAQSQSNALTAAYTADNIASNDVGGVVRQGSATTQTAKSAPDGTPYSTTVEVASYSGSPYRHLFIESAAQGYRAQVSLNDERFTNFLATLSVNSLDEVLNNELTAADQDVRRTQASYMSTILLSPIGGIITGVYKRLGEAVMAGETVLRVENNDTVNVSGAVSYNDVISLGDKVEIDTKLFGGASASLAGVVVAARCTEGNGVDNRWHVVLSCKNLDANNEHIVPMNYCLSDVDTTVTLS